MYSYNMISQTVAAINGIKTRPNYTFDNFVHQFQRLSKLIIQFRKLSELPGSMALAVAVLGFVSCVGQM
jgi:hypothetical protein